MRISVFILLITISVTTKLHSQEQDLTGIELSIDQDRLADVLRKEPYEDNNYAISLRLGFYGRAANHIYLGLPWVREKVDAFLIDKLLYNSGFEQERSSHNFVLTINGFTPSYVSDLGPIFLADSALGYDLAEDRPFSSFTGFRSTRRLEGGKRFVHSAYFMDIAVNTSFTFGLASIGWIEGLDNAIGTRRLPARLWDRNEDAPYPTGHVIPRPFPIFMYSVSGEFSVLRPLRKIVVQVRPELNLGYYTNVGFGIDFGKVMNVEKLVDNLGATDTHNPSVLKINNRNISLALTGSVAARAVLYNAHLNALYGLFGPDHYITLADTRKIIFESSFGAKIQLLKKIEFSMSFNWRSREIKLNSARPNFWGTIGLKFLIATEGEGCYDL